MPEPFLTDDLAGIDEYFRRSYKCPYKWPWLETFEGLAAEAKPELKVAKIVSLSVPAGFFRRRTLPSRYKYATWHWLSPNQKMRLADVQLLKNISGLNHVSDNEVFARQLILYCTRVKAEHPQLARWIERRSALLEKLAVHQTEIPSEAVNAQALALHRLAADLMAEKRGVSLVTDVEDLRDILAVIASEALRVLSRSGQKCRLSANLMIRTVLSDEVRSGTFLIGHSTRPADVAARVWGEDGQATECLVVVAETVKDKHAGFWVPLIRSGNGETLPGACRAYSYDCATAIFKHDLPDLTRLGFSASINERWNNYLTTCFEERLFVSFPIRTPLRRGSSSNVAAIVNINANPLDRDDWSRAYHREWLDVVEKNISILCALGCYSFLADTINTPMGTKLIDTRSDIVKMIPYIQPKLLSVRKDLDEEDTKE